MYCQSGNAHVVVAGGSLADDIAEQKKWIRPDSRFKKTFLWGLDYGSLEGTATFGEYGERILQHFAEHPQLGLIVRPHPLFPGAVVKYRVMSEEMLRSFYAQCNALPNVSLDLGGDLTGAFCRSDALISEPLSIQVEYLLTGQPALCLWKKEALDYRTYQEVDADVLAHYYVGDSFDRIVQFIEMAAADEDPLRECRDAVLERYFYRSQENADENIKELLKDHSETSERFISIELRSLRDSLCVGSKETIQNRRRDMADAEKRCQTKRNSDRRSCLSDCTAARGELPSLLFCARFYFG